MDETGAVETPVEQTTETASAPVEQTPDTSVPSADTSVEPEKNVSQSVPYDRFHEVNEQKKALEARLAAYETQVQTPQYQEPSQFDDETRSAIQAEINQGIVNYKVAEFRSKHGEELAKDELLAVAVERQMKNQASQGKVIDPELALKDAKDLLAKRLQPAVEKAKEEGVEEGRDIAKIKQQMGAVGETGKQPEVTDNELSAAELAKRYNIPRVN